MLQVRKVRAGDVKLADMRRYRLRREDEVLADSMLEDENGRVMMFESEEGVLVKAESERHPKFNTATQDRNIDWASLHMNLEMKDSIAPGTQLTLALMGVPQTEEFVVALNTKEVTGRVAVPENSVYCVTLDAGPGSFGPELRFHGKARATAFIQALLYHWFLYEEEAPSKMLAVAADGVCEVGNDPVDAGHVNPSND